MYIQSKLATSRACCHGVASILL